MSEARRVLSDIPCARKDGDKSKGHRSQLEGLHHDQTCDCLGNKVIIVMDHNQENKMKIHKCPSDINKQLKE